MPRMTAFPESHRDLLDAEFATLATIDPRGFPALSEVVFLHDDGEVRLSLNTARLKTRNLEARPECSLFILDIANPYRFLEIRGRARIERDDDYAFADKLGQKYGGLDARKIDGPGESRVVVTVEPVNVWPVNMRG
jgi:PPOX class probable F420-dependent enzyme